jgi:hypothetical protein
MRQLLLLAGCMVTALAHGQTVSEVLDKRNPSGKIRRSTFRRRGAPSCTTRERKGRISPLAKTPRSSCYTGQVSIFCFRRSIPCSFRTIPLLRWLRIRFWRTRIRPLRPLPHYSQRLPPGGFRYRSQRV